jgi:hypothetical protein
MFSKPHAKASIVFFTRDCGGRSSPPQSGYHPQISIGEVLTSCRIDSANNEIKFDFDEYHEVYLTLLLPNVYLHHLREGLSFRIYEGAHQVGNGIILQLCT